MWLSHNHLAHSGTFRLPTPHSLHQAYSILQPASSHAGLSISPAVTSKVPLLPPHPVLCKLGAFFKQIPSVPLVSGLLHSWQSPMRTPQAVESFTCSGSWAPCPALSWACCANPQHPGSICCLAEEQRSLLRARPWHGARPAGNHSAHVHVG